MLALRKKESISFHPNGLRDLSRGQAAIFHTPAMNHGIEVEGPLREGRAIVTMADGGERTHCPADPDDLVLRNIPNDHGVPAITGYLVAQNGAKTSDQAQAPEIMDPPQQRFFLPAELLSQGFEGGAGKKKVSLNQADQFFIFHGKLHRRHKCFTGFFNKYIYDL